MKNQLSTHTSSTMNNTQQSSHPFVSEKSEGKPWFEWCVSITVVLSAILALFKYTSVAVWLLIGISVLSASARLVLGDKSPWKIRSKIFDITIGYGFAIGLAITYESILAMTNS